MFTFTIILLLIVIAGWLDARLDWQQVNHHNQEERS